LEAEVAKGSASPLAKGSAPWVKEKGFDSPKAVLIFEKSGKS